MPHLPEALWWLFSCSRSCTSLFSSFCASYSRGHICLTFVFSTMLYGHSQPPKSIYQTHRFLMPQWGNIFYWKSLSHDSATPWSVDHQPHLSVSFSRQEYWSELPFPSPRVFLDPGIEPECPMLQAGSLPSEPPGKPQRILSGEYFQTWTS